jgi:hypothetical protein
VVAVAAKNLAIIKSFHTNAPFPSSSTIVIITIGEIINRKNNSTIFLN